MGAKRTNQIKQFLQKENIRNYSQLSKFIFEYRNYPKEKNFFENKCSDFCSSVLYLDGLFRKNKISKLKSFFPNNMWTQNNTGAPFNFTQTSTADEFKAETEDYSDTKSLEEVVKSVGGIVINSNNTIEDSGYIGVNFIEGNIEGLMDFIKNSTVYYSSVEELNKDINFDIKNIANIDLDKQKKISECESLSELETLIKSWQIEEDYKNDEPKEGEDWVWNPIIPLRRGLIIKYDKDNRKKDYQPTKGIKYNSNKLQMSKLFEQFPQALQAIVLCSTYGAQKYKETEIWDNFRNVQGGCKTYVDAAVRHLNEGVYNNDEESTLPHLYHACWNLLAAIELHSTEKQIDLKEYSQNFLKKLQNKFA